MKKIAIFLCAMFATFIKDPALAVWNIISIDVIKDVLKAIGILIAIVVGASIVIVIPVIPEVLSLTFLYVMREKYPLDKAERKSTGIAFVIYLFFVCYIFSDMHKSSVGVTISGVAVGNGVSMMLAIWLTMMAPTLTIFVDTFNFFKKKFVANWNKCSKK